MGLLIGKRYCLSLDIAITGHRYYRSCKFHPYHLDPKYDCEYRKLYDCELENEREDDEHDWTMRFGKCRYSNFV
jgi:hypothetical protein